MQARHPQLLVNGLAALSVAASCSLSSAVDLGSVEKTSAAQRVVLRTADIVVHADGSYFVHNAIDGKVWLKSVPPRLRIGSAWSALSLKAPAAAPASDSDTLGKFKRVDFTWISTASTSEDLTTSIRVYDSGEVVFQQTFLNNVTTDGRLGSSSPLSWWPALDHAASAPPLGYLGFSGCMSGGADIGTFNHAAEAEGTRVEAPSQPNLSLVPCKANLTSQEWKFLSADDADAAACAQNAERCMVENEGSRQCLQVSHCSMADGAVIKADVACKINSMCKGANLGWYYDSKNNALISTLSKKCLTAKGSTVTQEECKHTSDQIFYHDPKTGPLGTSSSPNPVPTTCLEAAASTPGHTPSVPPKLSGWGGYESGPLALFDASGRTLLLSPLTEHMSSVMNAGANSSAAVAVGVGGAVQSVPAGHSMQAILYSGDGIRDSYEAWGDAMMKFHGKKRTTLDHDVFISHLGYSTTAYYFCECTFFLIVARQLTIRVVAADNQCDCGYHWPRRCDATSPDNTPPSSLKGCKTYEDTLIDVHRSHQRQGLPISYFLVDSWWYGEREHGGVWM
jgi:hypothetical protein